MKVLRIALILGILAVVVAADENAEYEYEEEAPAPAPVPSSSSPSPPARGRGSLIAPRASARKPQPASSNGINRSNDKSAQKSTTTTTTEKPSTQAPENEEVEESPEYVEEGPEEQAEPVTPEIKKPQRRGDLRAILLRRRQQAQIDKSIARQTSSTTEEAPFTSYPHKKQPSGSNGRRGRNHNVAPAPTKSSESEPIADTPVESEPPKKHHQSRKYSSRNYNARSAPAHVVEEQEQEQAEEVLEPKPKPQPHFSRSSRRPAA